MLVRDMGAWYVSCGMLGIHVEERERLKKTGERHRAAIRDVVLKEHFLRGRIAHWATTSRSLRGGSSSRLRLYDDEAILVS